VFSAAIYLLDVVLCHFFSFFFLFIYLFFETIIKEGAVKGTVYDINWLLIVKVQNMVWLA
jgi:hypothetical protein